MKTKSLLILALVCVTFIASTGCKKEAPTKEQIIRPVRTIVVGDVQDLTNSTYPGITKEVQSVDMAFRVGGPLIRLNATEGQQVRTGQLIAEIDPRDFRVDLLAKEARFIQARAEEERFRATYERGSISKSEYDQKLALYLEAQSAFEAAKNALVDTKLRAPFDAFIDQKLVDNFERVRIGETIVTLIDLSAIEVRFSIPEALAIYFRQFENFTVSFDLYQDVTFIADLKEIAKKSERSAGIPVILVLRHKNTPDKKEKIVPGMACLIKVNLKDTPEEAEAEVTEFSIPTSSIYAQPDSDQKFVFVLNDEDMTVKKTEITIGTLVSTNLIWVLDGINKGDILVTAGANVLQDGQEVKYLN
jgi:RND family efflux transporter MFP subunit